MNFLLNYGEPKTEVDRKIRKAINVKNENLYKKHQEYDLSSLISPYYVNPYQRQMLKDIIGTKNVKDMEMLNALVHAGILNTECPPHGHHAYSEKYIDPVTGTIQCRRPVSHNRLNYGKDQIKLQYPRPSKKDDKDFSCPQPKDSPFAFEAYIDDMGQPRCRPPVVRGEFSGAPGTVSDGKDTMYLPEMNKHQTLYDGTGIMTEPSTMRSPSMYPNTVVPMQDTYVWHGDMYEKVNNYMNMFDNLQLNVDSIKDLNKLLKKSKYVKDFRDKFAKKSGSAELYEVVKNINTDDDLRIANTALYELMRHRHPEYMQKHRITYGGFMGK